MAERSWFFNSAPGDPRVYQASDFARYFGKVLSTGLLHEDNVPGLSVKTSGSDLRTYVEPGSAIMEGYAYENSGNEYLTHGLPEIDMNRIDRVVLRLDKRNNSRYIRLFVKDGTPAINPEPPSLTRDGSIWELSLAQVLVRANTSSINPADILDERLDRQVAGLVYSLISKPQMADIGRGNYSVRATVAGQRDFVIPNDTFDKDGDGLTVYLDGKKVPEDAYTIVVPRIVRFNSGLPIGSLVEFTVIRGVVKLPTDYPADASDVGIIDAGKYYEETNVEGALQKIGEKLFSQKQKVYGVRIDIYNPNPLDAVKYIDDAENIVSPSDWDNVFPFNKIKPCMLRNGTFQFYLNPNDYSKKLDGTPSNNNTFDNGDTMVEIPVIYWKVEKTSNSIFIRVSETKQEGFEAVAHTRGSIEHEKIYLSAYAANEGADSRLYSISGQTFKNSLTVNEARLKIANKGQGYQQIGLAQIYLWQILFILKYKSLNSDVSLGLTPNSFTSVSGSTDRSGMFSGSLDGSTPLKFIGVEQLVSRNHVLIDGFDSGKYSNRGSNFGDIGSYENALNYTPSINSGYLRDVVGSTFFPFFPSSANGSSSTYYSDFVNASTYGKRYSGLNVAQIDNGFFANGAENAAGTPQARFCYFI